MGTPKGFQFLSILGETVLQKLENMYCPDMISNMHIKHVGRYTDNKLIVYSSPCTTA
jgi:hypothetical protein